MGEPEKASLHVIGGGLGDPPEASHRTKIIQFGGGEGGDPPVDTETQRYVDANMRAVKAENSSSFARLEAKIDGIQPGATWQQNTGVMITGIVVGLGLVFLRSLHMQATDLIAGSGRWER